MNKEEEILDLLVNAWNKFLDLKDSRTVDIDFFCDGINKCQSVIGMRIARKARPDLFTGVEK